MSVTVISRPLARQTFLIAAPSVEYSKPSSGSRGETIWASRGCNSSMSSSMSSTKVNGFSDRPAFSVNSMKLPPKFRQAFSYERPTSMIQTRAPVPR